jgi:hypothetical protein
VPTYNDGEHAVNVDDAAPRVRATHDGVRAAVRTSIEHALTAGDLLIEAKKCLKHGEWLPWLEEHCKLSERTAQAYIRLSRHRGFIDAKSAVIADLTIADALELISAPRTSTSRSEGNPAWGAHRTSETRLYAPARLNSLMWSEADAETRRKFADAVGREVLDFCSPSVRDAIVRRWLADAQRKLVRHEPFEGDGLDIPDLLKRTQSAKPDTKEAA